MATDKIKIGLRIPKELRKRMLILAKKERWSLNDVGIVAVERYLKLRKV